MREREQKYCLIFIIIFIIKIITVRDSSTSYPPLLLPLLYLPIISPLKTYPLASQVGAASFSFYSYFYRNKNKKQEGTPYG